MDISDQALDLLKFVLLALLYLFFARVLWAVWSEVRRGDRPAAPAAAAYADERSATVAATQPRLRKPARGRNDKVARLAVLEPKAKRGQTHAVGGVVSIGRDPASTVVVDDDTFVSTHHARVYVIDGQVMIEDLGSTNGTFHNGNRLHGSTRLHRGDRIQIGYTVLEAQ